MAAAWRLAALALVSLVGCSTGPNRPTAETPKPVPVTGSADISGKITYSGAPVKPEPIDMDSVPACARQHDKPALSDAMIVAKDGSLANVYVWVKSGLPAAKPSFEQLVGAQIDQRSCIYFPHVVAIQAGQEVQFTNHDPTNHNIHPVPQLNAEVNRIQAPQGDVLSERFPLPEVGILVKCNVHPWMRAWVHVAPHPYFSLTGTDGSFKINGLPPGTYVLEAWHEKLGRQEVKVTVANGETTAANFTYR